MKIAVIGTGYVGLVTGTCLAETGNDVTCVDINQQKVDMLREGQSPIYEPGLQTLLHRNIAEHRLHFTTNLAEAVSEATIIFLALPTPPGGDGAADLSYVLGASRDIALTISSYKVIVTKSTVPVGTADKVKAIFKQYTDVEVAVVSNPEFLREGVAIEDFMKPDRIVIGTTDETAKGLLNELYAPYVRQGNPIVFMDERSSELTKYAANSFLATKISFMNEVANLCEKVGADVDMIRLGIGADERIGKRFLFSGIGYGGSCFPKDVQALARSASENDYEFKILNAVMDVNALQKSVLVSKIKAFYGDDLTGKTFALWGLAFKPETDDIREAPALQVIDELLSSGAKVNVYDPEAMKNVEQLLGATITYAENQYDALNGADALLILTEWSVFRNPDFIKMSNLLGSKVIFDGRNLFDVAKMNDIGFYYNSMGRATVGSYQTQSV
ncbi:UDP-glucose/GDP-mannose dehydrogenase family protein [Mucilaginibacter pallidiroseus]|uniref:UDP-glucose 6-dehydrogenase n=1 Tax=Mucilaginibacter pallidiroseus TaxID=2599295 RepID=A0A563UBU4_9SPHI|nr:UDP-glucose/GDP-mannose dehydrogenase family protein [Mucilaginibacter pallidiroseus]TWR28848.1 UDP-glucose/GDP-mannose dehydrogenase family protein [Mucilaginibacter pallidiroseus]